MAEADAESKRLQGRGLANQRMEIAKGIRESIDTIKETGVSEEEEHGAPERLDTPLQARRHLVDLYAMAYIDSQLAEAERQFIQSFAAATSFPEHLLADIERLGRKRARKMLRDLLSRKPTE